MGLICAYINKLEEVVHKHTSFFRGTNTVASLDSTGNKVQQYQAISCVRMGFRPGLIMPVAKNLGSGLAQA